jgi:hypothetical protein
MSSTIVGTAVHERATASGHFSSLLLMLRIPQPPLHANAMEIRELLRPPKIWRSFPCAHCDDRIAHRQTLKQAEHMPAVTDAATVTSSCQPRSHPRTDQAKCL